MSSRLSDDVLVLLPTLIFRESAIDSVMESADSNAQLADSTADPPLGM